MLSTVIGVASETYSCAPSPIQVAATQAYGNIALANDFLAKQISLLDDISQYCSDTLKRIGVKVHAAQGGFYLFPDFGHFREKLNARNIKTSEQLTSALLTETGVALLPGSAFGMQESSLTARLAFVDFDGEQVFNDEPGEHEHEYEKVKHGINELCGWLSAL